MTGATNVTPHASEPVEGSRPELQTMSLIDLHLPRYQFVQRHTTYVVAPPDRILDTILSGALAGAWLDEDRLMRALVALRFAGPLDETRRRIPPFELIVQRAELHLPWPSG